MFIIEIPRKHLSSKEEKTGVRMYFDVQLNDQDGKPGPRVNGFRLVGKEGRFFLGFPSIVGKDGKHYPAFIPTKDLSETIQIKAEQEYAQAKG